MKRANLDKMLTRWRNTRGFGVHSPFGFQIVKRVIKSQSGYAYYAYADIERCCHKDHTGQKTAEEAKMLLRLTCMVKADSIFLPPDCPKAFKTALRGANSKIRFISNPSRLSGCNIAAISFPSPYEAQALSNDAKAQALSKGAKAVVLSNGAEAEAEGKAAVGLSLNALKDFISLPEKTLLLKNLPAGWAEKLFDSMKEGIMLLGKRNAILISRPEMQKVSYLISI